MIKVQVQLSLKDFRKVNLSLLFQKLSIKIFVGIGVFIFLSALLRILILGFKIDQIGHLAFGITFVFFLPLIIVYKANQSYKSNPKIQELITYQFDENKIEMSGSSFRAEMSWESLYKVTESKECIFLWQGKQIANTIPTRFFKPDDLVNFREMIKNKHNLKYKLKA